MTLLWDVIDVKKGVPAEILEEHIARQNTSKVIHNVLIEQDFQSREPDTVSTSHPYSQILFAQLDVSFSVI